MKLKLWMAVVMSAVTVLAQIGGPTRESGAIGWKDDGSESGLVRSAVVEGGNLVPVSFTKNQATAAAATGGTTAVGFNVDTITVSRGFSLNTTAFLKCDTVAGSFIDMQVPFSGRTFGVAGCARGIYGFRHCTAVIDGVAYPFPSMLVYANGNVPNPDEASWYIIARHLSDGPHIAEIVVQSDLTTIQLIDLYAVLVESRAGYAPPVHSSYFLTPYLITVNTRVVMATAFPGSSRYSRGIGKLRFYNSSGAPVTVSVDYNTTTFWTAAVPATGVSELELGSPPANISNELVGFTCATANVITVSGSAVGF